MRRSKVEKERSKVWILGTLVVVLALITAGAVMFAVGGGDEDSDATGMATKKLQEDAASSGINPDLLGKASTLSFSAFTGSWGDEGSETEVYPTYTIVKDGSKIVNDAKANSTTDVVVGDKVSIFGTGSAYYLPANEDVVVDSEKATSELEAYTAVATTDLVITAYDEEGDALTADDGANNTADYAGGDVAASAEQVYFVKLKQNSANLNFNLGMQCTWILGDEADDFELDADEDWKEVPVPDKLDSATITMYDDINASTAEKGFKHCYVPGDSLVNKETGAYLLKENDDTGKMKYIFDSDDTTQPTANGDTYFGVSFMDASYSVDKNGVVQFGAYMDDDTEDPGAVGIDESADTNFNGLDIAVAIEPQ